MRKKSFLTGVAIGLFAAAAFASPSLAGGFQEVDTDDSDVVLASRYLASEVSTETGMSIDVVDRQVAMTQVVAGTNFRLCMAVTVNDYARRHLAGVIYKPLSGGLALIRWGWVPSCFAGGKEGL